MTERKDESGFLAVLATDSISPYFCANSAVICVNFEVASQRIEAGRRLFLGGIWAHA